VIHLKSPSCEFSFGIGTSGFSFASFNSDPRLTVQGFVIRIIRCAISCWASWSLVWMACIKLFTVQFRALAPFFSISLILRIFRCTWSQPNRLKTLVIEWMESRRCSDLKFESNWGIDCNSPAYTVFRLLLMRLIKHSKTPWTVWELAIAWWFCYWC